MEPEPKVCGSTSFWAPLLFASPPRNEPDPPTGSSSRGKQAHPQDLRLRDCDSVSASVSSWLLRIQQFVSKGNTKWTKQKTFDTKRQEVNLNPSIFASLHTSNILRRDFKKLPKVIAYYFTEAVWYILTLSLTLSLYWSDVMWCELMLMLLDNKTLRLINVACLTHLTSQWTGGGSWRGGQLLWCQIGQEIKLYISDFTTKTTTMWTNRKQTWW